MPRKKENPEIQNEVPNEKEMWLKLLEISMNHLNLNWHYVFGIRKWAILVITGILAFFGAIHKPNNGVNPWMFTIILIVWLWFWLLDVIALSWVWNTLKKIEIKQQRIAKDLEIPLEIIKTISLRNHREDNEIGNIIDAFKSSLIFYGLPIVIYFMLRCVFNIF